MYIAMNRFRITPGSEDEFISIWKNRDTHLDSVPGFREFHLIKGPSNDECTLFASHSVWESEQDFENWTREKDRMTPAWTPVVEQRRTQLPRG